MERIVYDQSGRPVEFARHLYRASRYAFTTSFPGPTLPSADGASLAAPPALAWRFER